MEGNAPEQLKEITQVTISHARWMEIHKNVMRKCEDLMERADSMNGKKPDSMAKMMTTLIALNTLIDVEKELWP